MNAWTIYWILQLDSINGFVGIAAFLSGALFVAIHVFILLSAGEDHWSWNQENMPARLAYRARAAAWGKRLAILVAVLLPINALLPSTKTAAAMVIVPAIANNETIRKESGELYDLAKQALRDAVTDKAKSAAKEATK